MRRTVTAATIAIAATVVLVGCSSTSTTAADASSDGSTTIRIAQNNTASSLLISVAEAEGYFDDEHLDVKSTALSDITVIPSLLGKQYDIGFSVAPIIVNAASSGVDVVAVSGNDGESDVVSTEVIGREGITKASQLDGMKIGTPTLTGNLNLLTKAWLDAKGVDPTSVQYVQVAAPNMVDQLKAGRIDAAEVQNPYIGVAESDGLNALGSVDRALGDEYVGQSFWVASGAWAKANPTAVTRFRAALDKAADWIADHPADAYEQVAKSTGVSLAVAKKSPIGAYSTSLEAKEFTAWIAAMKQYNGFTGSVTSSDLVDTDK